MDNLIRRDLLKFQAYSSARDEAEQGEIWLNANESPYAFNYAGINNLNRYPSKQPEALLNKFSEIFNVKTNQLILSSGSDAAIDLLTRLFCCAGQDAIMVCTPTFGMYVVCAQLQGVDVYDVPLLRKEGYRLDLTSIESCWVPQVKIIFLCSPNNPTGNLIGIDEVLYLCEKFLGKSIIVVDEAYIEFSASNSLAKYINLYNNLVILRTLSKAYGLAGVRCGFILAQESLLQWIMKIMSPYPLPSVVVKTIDDALSVNRLEEIKQQIENIKNERNRLFSLLKNMKVVKNIWPSEANFILIEVNNLQKVIDKFSSDGIVVRSFNNKQGLKNCIRISIGLPCENIQVVNVLSKVGNDV